MKLLDWTLPAPEQNLAADEALLDWCEAREGEEVLRFWESAQPFVVVGYANAVAAEVNVVACAARGVPVLRRCTGGGTVLQGPGCLNYALVLRIDPHGPTRSIAATNQYVMERNAQALRSELRTPNSELLVQGHTDLTLDGLKVSGNAQRRKRRCLLFHGTVLLGLDLRLVAELLPMPTHQPGYRQNRSHGEFIRHLPLSTSVVKRVFCAAWAVDGVLALPPMAAVDSLVMERYGRREWNLRTEDATKQGEAG